ncbi:hypothetical protein AAMO2058_001487300 [Amorphochlora amoebiformis]
MSQDKGKRCEMKKKCKKKLDCYRIHGHEGTHSKCPHPNCRRLVDDCGRHTGQHAWCIKWDTPKQTCIRCVTYSPEKGPKHLSFCKLINNQGILLRALGIGISTEENKKKTKEWYTKTWPRLKKEGFFEKRQHYGDPEPQKPSSKRRKLNRKKEVDRHLGAEYPLKPKTKIDEDLKRIKTEEIRSTPLDKGSNLGSKLTSPELQKRLDESGDSITIDKETRFSPVSPISPINLDDLLEKFGLPYPPAESE